MVIVDFRRIRMDNQNNKDNNSNNNRQGWGIILFTTLLVTFVVMALYSLMQGSNPEEITYDRFLELVEEGDVESVELGSSRILITLTDDARKEIFGSGAASGSIADQLQSQSSSSQSEDSGTENPPDYYTGYVSDDTLAQRLDEAGVEFKGTVPDTAGSVFFELMVTLVLPVVLFGLLFMFVMKRDRRDISGCRRTG